MIASCWVGAAEDLIRNGINGWIFDEMTAEALEDCMKAISSWSEDVLDNARRTAIGIATGYGSGGYHAAISAVIGSLD